MGHRQNRLLQRSRSRFPGIDDATKAIKWSRSSRAGDVRACEADLTIYDAIDYDDCHWSRHYSRSSSSASH